MLRAVAMTLAWSVLTAACALVEQPPPADTTPIQIEVRNLTEQTVVELFVLMRGAEGTLEGAARPASVPPKSTIDVTFYVPTARDWIIMIGPTGQGVAKWNLEEADGEGCTSFIEVSRRPLSFGGFALSLRVRLVARTTDSALSLGVSLRDPLQLICRERPAFGRL